MRRMKGCLVLCAVLLAMLCPLGGASAQGIVAIVMGEVEAGAFSPPAQWTDSDDAPQVLWASYPLNTATSMDRMAAALLDFARMPEVGTLILCPAMPGSAQVLAQARELRPDLQLLVLLPQEPAETIGAVADLVLDINRIAQAERAYDGPDGAIGHQRAAVLFLPAPAGDGGLCGAGGGA